MERDKLKEAISLDKDIKMLNDFLVGIRDNQEISVERMFYDNSKSETFTHIDKKFKLSVSVSNKLKELLEQVKTDLEKQFDEL